MNLQVYRTPSHPIPEPPSGGPVATETLDCLLSAWATFRPPTPTSMTAPARTVAITERRVSGAALTLRRSYGIVSASDGKRRISRRASYSRSPWRLPGQVPCSRQRYGVLHKGGFQQRHRFILSNHSPGDKSNAGGVARD